MKILVFEYITGGGFNKRELPDSLADEGRLMLQALLNNFRALLSEHETGLSVMVMMDSRMNGSIDTAGFETVVIHPEHNSHEEFASITLQCDAVWPIAPEFDGILHALCRTVETLGKRLLTSPAGAVALTGDKFKAYQHLKKNFIATVPTRKFTSCCSYWDTWSLVNERMDSTNLIGKIEKWLVKPIDGAGCTDSYILSDQGDFERMRLRKGQYVIQPHIEGKKTSLSCLFKQGNGWLLCVNLQQFKIVEQQYHLSTIIVNHDSDLGVYQGLVDSIACALPELWGYAGIDLIETSEQVLVLEINPRLTTSFVGISAALGINVVENILQLIKGNPILKSVCNQPITIKVEQNESD